MNAFRLMGLSLVLFSFGASAQNYSFNSKDIHRLQIKSDAGNIEILGGSETTTQLTATPIVSAKACKLSAAVQNHVLVIESQICEQKLSLQVPKNIDTVIVSGMGDVRVDNTQGKLNLELGTGNSILNGVITELSAKTGAGDITVTGLKAQGTLLTGSGDIKIKYADDAVFNAQQQATLDIRAGSGDAIIEVPARAKVTTAFDAGSGTLKNDFTNSARANLDIRMETGNGDLSVKRF